MTWLFVSAASYFFNAVAAVVDKFLLKRAFPHPSIYAFYVSLFGALAVFFAFFGLVPLRPLFLASGIFAGVVFTFALLFFFSSLREGVVSRVVPLVGGLTSVFILFLAWFVLGENLSQNEFFAFVIILFGSYLVSREGGEDRLSRRALLFGILGALLFAFSHTLSKFTYVNLSFSAGFFVRGLGSVLGAIVLLAIRDYRQEILASLRRPPLQSSPLFFFGQGSAALAFILLNYAFVLGPIALINSLGGVQYLIVFLFAIFLAKKYPLIFRELLTPKAVLQKSISIILIGVGVFLLFL